MWETRHLSKSYLLSDKLDLFGLPLASGSFANVRMGVFEGNTVVVKTLRVSEMDGNARIRKVESEAPSFSSRLAYTRYSASAKDHGLHYHCGI